MTVRRAVAASALITAIVLALDVATRPGTGLPALYAIPLLVVSYAGPPKTPVPAAAVASLLIVGRVLVVPLHDLPETVLVNRAIALAIVWVAADMARRLRQASVDIAGSTHDLAEIKYALDQSAIVATTNTRGAITYVNDTFCEISKYKREELLGQDHRILNSGYHSREFMRTLWVTIANGRVWRGEIRNRAKDGSHYWVDTTIVPFLDGRGKPYQYMAIRYEITARKRSEAMLREQAALTRLGEMAAVVAHEVKNPIAGIRGALQVILGRMPEEQRDREVIGDIIARLDNLNGIVHDLLIYAHPRPPRIEQVELPALVEDIGALLRRDPEWAGVALHVDGAAPPLAGDPSQLRIMLQNLLLNAAQAMKGRGTIDVSMRSDDSGCRVAIRDRGPGMAPEVLEKAFDAFFTTKHRGTGLGLAIARRVVDSHGGHITIGAADGGGTLVSVWLPRHHASG